MRHIFRKKHYLFMSVKMRLARHGRKRYAFYHIVVANSRAPRDGRYIERIGSYNPNTNPATIDLDFDKAYDWLEKGAQPTDTVRAILSYKGVLYKKHLAGGVKKGALTQDEADRKLDAWMTDKDAKIQAKKNSLLSLSDKVRREMLAAEAKVNEKRTADQAAKNSVVAAKAAAATAKPAEEVPEEVPEETPEITPQVAPEEIPQEVPEETPEKIPQEAPEAEGEKTEEVGEA